MRAFAMPSTWPLRCHLSVTIARYNLSSLPLTATFSA